MKKENRKHLVPTDEPYVQNINLVTGDKFDYDRPLLTQRQIKQLCIDQTKSNFDKFMHILQEGQKIQKWSIFQNLSYYISSAKEAHKIFDTLNKNYTQIGQFLSIIADGISIFLDNPPKDLAKQTIQILYELSYRTLTQNPLQVQDWGKVYQKIVKYPHINYQKSIDFVNGSFSMNSPPQRRRVAFTMMNHLMELVFTIDSKNCPQQNQNSKTRYEICCILKKIIQTNNKQQQIWKAVWEYFYDKDFAVRQLSLKILCSIYYSPNFQNLANSLSEESSEPIFSKYINDFIVTFRNQIQMEQRPKIQIISFINRVFKSKKTQNICNLLNNITVGVIQILGEGKIYQDVNFSFLPLKNKQVLETLFMFFHQIQDFQFKDNLKNLIFKALKELQYEVYGNLSQLGQMFDLSQEDEVAIYLTICTKMLQSSKWHQLENVLQYFSKMVLCQILYQKACYLILKLWMSCPSFLMSITIQCVIYLILINRKSLQFLITVRQKVLNSKFWSHRKNYIIFYTTMKAKSSFDYHKLIPTLMYKNIVADKSVGVRLTFLQCASKIYKYTQPINAQKNMLREAVSKLEQDKDQFVRDKAAQIQKQLVKIDKDSRWMTQIYDSNRQMILKQAALPQVSAQSKRVIKTENQISKSTAKSKKRIGNQQRKTINVGKVGSIMHKDISIDSITLNGNQNNQKLPSTNLIPKKNNLFRCHSVKIKGPTKKV